MNVQDLFKAERLTVPGTLRGYRSWRVPTMCKPGLRSTAMPYSWGEPGVTNTATCDLLAYFDSGRATKPKHDEPAPHTDCVCGYYAWYHPDDRRVTRAKVFGVIEAHGRMVLGTHGFKAQHARILAVTTEDEHLRQVLLLTGYEVFDSPAELAERYPPEDVSALVDHSCDGGCIDKTAIAIRQHVLSINAWVQQAYAAQAAAIAEEQRRLTEKTETMAERIKQVSYHQGDQPLYHVDDAQTLEQKLRDAALEARRHRNTGPAKGPMRF